MDTLEFTECGGCIFYRPAEPPPEPGQIFVSKQGTCMRQPPNAHPVGRQNELTGQQQIGAIAVRPPVASTDGCGEGLKGESVWRRKQYAAVGTGASA